MKKRTVSLLLAVLMLLALLPANALPEAKAVESDRTAADDIYTDDKDFFRAGAAIPTASDFHIQRTSVAFAGVYSSDTMQIWSRAGSSFAGGKCYCIEFHYYGSDNPDLLFNGIKQDKIIGSSSPYTYRYYLGMPPCSEYEDCAWITVSDRDALVYYLESPGRLYLKLGDDIETDIDPLPNNREDREVARSIDYEIHVHGEKVLDLNGYNITNDDCRNAVQWKKHGYSNDWRDLAMNNTNMFEICADADMTVIDSEGSGRIFHDAYYIGTTENTPNSDDYYFQVTTRNLFTVYGKLTVNGGKLVAGGSKKQYMWRYAKHAYQVVHGTDVKVIGGSFIANGGTYIGNGKWGRCISAEAGSRVIINGGTFTGYCGDVFLVDENTDITVRAGEFKTAKCGDYIRNSLSDHSGISDAEYGCIGIPKSAIVARTVVKQNHESAYDPKSDGNTTVTPVDYTGGKVITAGGKTVTDYNAGTSCSVAFHFDTLYPEQYLSMNPAGTGEAASKQGYLRNGVTDYRWMLYKQTRENGNTMWKKVFTDPVTTTGPEANLKTLYSGWEFGETYMLKAEATEYWSGSSNSSVCNVSSAEQLTIRVMPREKLDRVEVQMNETGLLAGTPISHYSFSSDNPAIAAILTHWYEKGNPDVLKGSEIIQEDKQYWVELNIVAAAGYSFDFEDCTLIDFNGNASGIVSYSTSDTLATWDSDDITPCVPTEVYVEGELLTKDNPVHNCSGGGKATLNPYSNTLTLENAVIHGADMRGINSYFQSNSYASTGVYIKYPAEYSDVDYTRTLFTLALKGENLIDVDSVESVLNGTTVRYGEGIESVFALQIIQGDAEGSLKFTGTAVDSIYVHNNYDDPDDPDDYDPNDGTTYHALFLNAPVTDFSRGGMDLSETGYLVVGGAGSFRGKMVHTWGLKLEEEFNFYATWKESTPLEQRKAEFKYTAEQYRTQDQYAYVEIGRDYGVRVKVSGWYPVHVNSANADDVLHDGGSVKYTNYYFPTITLTDAELYGGSDPAFETDCYYLNLNLYGDNMITMYGAANAAGTGEYTAVKNDGGVINLGGTGNLTICAENEGKVYGYGILCNTLNINMGGALVIRDAVSGINTAGIHTMSGGQAYVDYLNYSSGMVTVYAPELPSDSVHKYRNRAANRSPVMAGGSWAGEWMCYVGNEDDLSKAVRYTGEESAELNGYRYLKLWRSEINLVVDHFWFDRKSFQTTFAYNQYYTYYTDVDGVVHNPASATVYDSAGREYTRTEELEIGKTYWYQAEFPLNGKVPDTGAELLVGDQYSHITAAVPFLEEAEARNYTGSYYTCGNDTLTLVYKFTVYGFLVRGLWSSSDGTASTEPIYADGELAITRESGTVTYKAGCTENGFSMNVIEPLHAGDVLTLNIPGYIACGENSMTYKNGDTEWIQKFSLLGDVNDDGSLNMKDVSSLFRWWNGNQTLSDKALLRGDFDESGSTDLKDAASIFSWMNEA